MKTIGYAIRRPDGQWFVGCGYSAGTAYPYFDLELRKAKVYVSAIAMNRAVNAQAWMREYGCRIWMVELDRKGKAAKEVGPLWETQGAAGNLIGTRQ